MDCMNPENCVVVAWHFLSVVRSQLLSLPSPYPPTSGTFLSMTLWSLLVTQFGFLNFSLCTLICPLMRVRAADLVLWVSGLSLCFGCLPMMAASYFVWFECNVGMKFLLGSRTVHMAMFNFMFFMFSYISLLDTSIKLVYSRVFVCVCVCVCNVRFHGSCRILQVRVEWVQDGRLIDWLIIIPKKSIYRSSPMDTGTVKV